MPDPHHRMREGVVALIAREPGRVGLEHPPQAVGCHPPVVVRVAVNPEIQRRRDDEHAPRLEDAKHFVERPAHLENVLECLDAEHRAGRRVGQG